MNTLDTREMTYYSDSDIDEALEIVRVSKVKKTVISTNEFNNVINKMLNELKNTPLKEFEAKKEEVIDYALHNYYKIDKKTVDFNRFMSNLRLYISKLKTQVPRRSLEERKEEAAKRLRSLLNKLENAQNEYEWGITENQIFNIVDSFNEPEKSNDARIILNELRQNWEHKRLKDNEEQWRDIDGLEGEYAISSKGRVQNLKNGKILTGVVDSYGYKKLILKGKTYKIHRLVALAFIPNPNKLPQVDHVDEDKTNNNVSNLRWVSPSENIRHSTHKQSCKVKQLSKDSEIIKVWDSFNQIQKETGYNKSNIINTCKGKLRSAYGYCWEYMDPSSQRTINRPVIVHRGDEYIGEFPSAAKASKALGLCDVSVYYCLSGRLPSTHGYAFTYK